MLFDIVQKMASPTKMLFVASLMFCGAVKANSNSDENSSINEQLQTITVVTEHLPPFQIAKDNRLVGGINYHYVKNLFEAAEIPFKIEVMPWARAFKTASEQKNTFIFSMVKSPTRQEDFHWLVQLQDVHYVIYGSLSRTDIKVEKLSDALNYTAVAVRDTYEATLLKQLGFREGRNLIQLNEAEDVWNMVASGRMDLTIASTLQFNQKRKLRFKVIKQTDFKLTMYLASNKRTDENLNLRIKQQAELFQTQPAFLSELTEQD